MGTLIEPPTSAKLQTTTKLGARFGEGSLRAAAAEPLDYYALGQRVVRRDGFQMANPLFADRSTSAQLFVGSARFATNRALLDQYRIRRIVYCQDPGEGAMPFDREPGFRYCAFPIGFWRRTPLGQQIMTVPPSARAAAEYFAPLFAFVEEAMKSGENCLVHCLAGAHRAGTAGIACLMKFEDLSKEEAIRVAQAARPVIDPIGDFTVLLTALEAALLLDGSG